MPETSSPHRRSGSNAKNELISIQLLRALASILVLMAHLQVKEIQYGDASSLLWQHFNVGAIGVDIFFVLSGFIIFFVAGNVPSTTAAATRFFKLRVIRVLPMYWLLTTAALIVFYMHPEIVNKTASKPTVVLESYFLLPTDNKLLIQNGWTLSYEMLFYFSFCALIFLPARFRAPALVTAACLTVGLGVFITPQTVTLKFLSSNLLLEFAYGVVLGAIFISPERPRYFTPFLGATLLILGAASIALMISINLGFGAARGYRYGIPAALLVFAALALERQSRALSSLKILGDSSYSLYLLHGLSLAAVGMVWKKFHLHGAASNLAMLLTMAAVSIVSAIALHLWVEKPLLGYMRRGLRL